MVEPQIEALWRESGARLRAWFERHTHNASDAEDLVQETFVRVHERLETLLDAHSVRAWVGTIARNVLVDHQRRLAARPAAERMDNALEAHVPEPAPRDDDDPDNLDATVASWLEPYLAELDPADAEALRFVDLEGRTQREYAIFGGLSLSGAKSRVQRARERLRARLEACCAFAFDARGGIIGYERKQRESCSGGECADDC